MFIPPSGEECKYWKPFPDRDRGGWFNTFVFHFNHPLEILCLFLNQYLYTLCVEDAEKARAASKRSKHVKAKLKHRQEHRKIEQRVADQFNSNQLFACISSRPGQSGRLDGYILEGRELEFYIKKLERRKK